MVVNLHPHQQVAVDKMHNGCVLYGGVGTGKSITAMAYFVSKVCGGEYGKHGTMTAPRDLYIITTAKKRDSLDWELEAARFGIFGDSRKSMNEIKLTVDSWNNIKDYVDVENAFFIFDEQRVVGYGAWSRAFIKIARANQFVLLSATPGDTWLDYIPLFIANGWYRNKTDFLDQHVIWTPRVKYPKVLRYQNVGKLVDHRNNVLVHMPYERHTIRHSVDVMCDYDQDAFNKVVKKRWHVFEQRPLRDVSELFSVMRKVVNSDASRLAAVRRLLNKHPKLIVFYNFDYELEILRTLSPAMVVDSCSRSTFSGTQTEPQPEPRSSTATGRPTGRKLNSPDRSGMSTGTTPSRGPGTDRFLSHAKPVQTAPALDVVSGITGRWTEDDGTGEEFVPFDENWEWLLSDEGMLANQFGETFAVAEWNGHKHEPIPATARWLYLVQYRAGAEGWNCVETDAICFYSQTYSYRDWWQSHGRIDRLNTPFTDLYYYNLISTSVIDKAIRKALKAKKNFNERDLAV